MLGLGLSTHKNAPVLKNIVKDGLVLWLDGKDFKNYPPTTNWIDKSDKGNNAVPSGFAYTAVSGSDGNGGGVIFDGVNDVCIVPQSNLMSLLGNNFTLGITLKFNSMPLNYNHMLFCRRAGVGVNYEYIFYYTQIGNFVFTYTLDGQNMISLSFPYVPTIGVEYDIVLKRLDNKLYLIVNNVQNSVVNTITGIIYQSNTNLLLGASVSGAYNNFLNGTVKRFFQYNRSLTDTEILKNYNAIK